ncbi:MAG: hypothetical protein ACK6DC_21235 [Planctomycetota bacterium]
MLGYSLRGSERPEGNSHIRKGYRPCQVSQTPSIAGRNDTIAKFTEGYRPAVALHVPPNSHYGKSLQRSGSG